MVDVVWPAEESAVKRLGYRQRVVTKEEGGRRHMYSRNLALNIDDDKNPCFAKACELESFPLRDGEMACASAVQGRYLLRIRRCTKHRQVDQSGR